MVSTQMTEKINLYSQLQSDILGYLAENYHSGIQDNLLEDLTKVFDAPLVKIADAVKISFAIDYHQSIESAQKLYQDKLVALAKEMDNLA